MSTRAKQHPAIKAVHFKPAPVVRIIYPDYDHTFVPVAYCGDRSVNLPNVERAILEPLHGLSADEFFVAVGRLGGNTRPSEWRDAWEWARSLNPVSP